MTLFACLTCHNARKGDLGIGQARCLLDGQAYNVMHVCFAFEHISKNVFLDFGASALSGTGSYVIPVQTLTGESQ